MQIRLTNVLFSDKVSAKFLTEEEKKDKHVLYSGLAAFDEFSGKRYMKISIWFYLIVPSIKRDHSTYICGFKKTQMSQKL